jgi:hypothetical protein
MRRESHTRTELGIVRLRQNTRTAFGDVTAPQYQVRYTGRSHLTKPIGRKASLAGIVLRIVV